MADLTGCNIVFISGILKNGGVARRVSNLSDKFAQAGASVTFLLTEGIDKDHFGYNSNVKLVSLPEYTGKNAGKQDDKTKLKLKLLKYAENACKALHIKRHSLINQQRRYIKRSVDMRKFFENNPGSIVIPFGIEYYLSAYYAVKGLNCKLIFAERVAPQMEKCSAKELEHRFYCLKKADYSVFQTTDELEFYSCCPKDKATVIPNPISEKLPMRYTGEREKTIVNFCRIAKQKNLELLIEAFEIVSDKYPEYRLQIYGNTVCEVEEQYKQSIIKMAQSTKCADKIEILPPRSDIHSVVLKCGMFVCSSDFEGISNSMLEALAIGLPSVCTDCLGGGAREYIKDGVNGLLVPMNDASALANAMIKFIEDPQFAESCGKEAEKIRYELSAQKITERWMQVINKCR